MHLNSGIFIFIDKEPPEEFNMDENKEINIVQNLICETSAIPRKKSASINLGRPCDVSNSYISNSAYKIFFHFI